MKPRQARLRSDSATRVVMSRGSIPATASAHKAVTLSASTKVRRGSAVPASRRRVNATPAKSRAASAWLHRTRVTGMMLACAFRPQHDADRLEDDQQVEERRVVLGIIEVVFELLARIVDRGAIGVVDLRPAGDARLHHMALGIVIELLLQILDELRAFGARADEAHLALEHAPALRQFVDPRLADETTDAGDARVVLLRPHHLAADLNILAHRTQLNAVEALTKQTNTTLAVEDRPLAFELDGDRGDDDQ